MIKMTIVTDLHGKLIGAVSGHTLTSRRGNVEAHVSFQPGHTLHQVEVGEDMDMTTIADAAAFQAKLLKYLPRS